MKSVYPPPFLACLVAIAVLIAVPAPISLAAPPAEPPLASAPAAFSCDNVTEIPKVECEALVALYNSTNGPGWTPRSSSGSVGLRWFPGVYPGGAPVRNRQH